jgi:hypothetical protein
MGVFLRAAHAPWTLHDPAGRYTLRRNTRLRRNMQNLPRAFGKCSKCI